MNYDKADEGQVIDLADAAWRRSSYSGAQGDCVEVADGVAGLAPVRDSKRAHGANLLVPASAWASFVESVKQSV